MKTPRRNVPIPSLSILAMALASSASLAQTCQDPIPPDLSSAGMVVCLNELRGQLRAEIDKVNALQSQLNQIQTRLMSAPNGAWQTEQNFGGGLNAVGKTSQCPPGQVVVGLQIVTGGTCHSQCDPDGRPIHTFRVLCAPRY